MEHVLLLEDRQVLEDLFDCSEGRPKVGICSSSLGILDPLNIDIVLEWLKIDWSGEVFEFLISMFLMLYHPLASCPVLTHLRGCRWY